MMSKEIEMTRTEDLTAAMDTLYARAQEGKNDSARCGNYSMLIGVYESTIKLLLSDERYNADLVLQDLEAAMKFFRDGGFWR
jgi:hypothetical protein